MSLLKPAAATLILPLLFAVSLPFHAHASAIGLTIQPVKISETMHAGDTVRGSIHLTNASDIPVSVDMSVQDFIPLAGADTIQFVGRTEGVTSVRDWVTIDAKGPFTFQRGESKDIPYTIVAPANAEPGGHFGVVFFKATSATTGETLKIGTQVGMLVLVAIPGNHLQKGQILDFTTTKFIQQGPETFTMKFQNTGTVHFEPKGEIIIRNMFGAKVGSVPIEGQVVLPTSIKDLKLTWNVKGILLGRYTASATVYDGEGTELTTKNVSFWAFPIWYGLGFIVVFGLLFMLLRFLKRRVKISFNAN
ncbi:MAG: exported protein of unknown function [Parcubacteria group bacterium]|nr:exported protein of unknown function [Parcubacteria group bacterium]